MKRVPFGIRKLDLTLEGGLPENTVTLISGAPGTGKSLLALSFLYYGITSFKEEGMFISFEQRKEEIVLQGERIGFSLLPKLVNSGKILINTHSINSISKNTVDKIISSIKKSNVQRVVIDSLSSISINTPIYEFARDALWRELRGNAQLI
ncbi:hypothetical protein D6783_02640, partial [Candidatus Woesearchaeota archaeon]